MGESLDDVEDETIEGGIAIAVEVIDGGGDDELTIEHVNCNFELLERGYVEAVDEDLAEEQAAFLALNGDDLMVAGEEGEEEGQLLRLWIEFNF